MDSKEKTAHPCARQEAYRRAVSAGTNGIAGRGGGSVAMAASRSYFMCSRTLSIAAAMMYILVSDGQIFEI